MPRGRSLSVVVPVAGLGGVGVGVGIADHGNEFEHPSKQPFSHPPRIGRLAVGIAVGVGAVGVAVGGLEKDLFSRRPVVDSTLEHHLLPFSQL